MHLGENIAFCYFSLRVLGKSLVFQPKPTWNSAYKYNSFHSKILIQNEVVQEEGMHDEHQGRSLNLYLQRYFISFVICLRLP